MNIYVQRKIKSGSGSASEKNCIMKKTTSLVPGEPVGYFKW